MNDQPHTVTAKAGDEIEVRNFMSHTFAIAYGKRMKAKGYKVRINGLSL